MGIIAITLTHTLKFLYELNRMFLNISKIEIAFLSKMTKSQ